MTLKDWEKISDDHYKSKSGKDKIWVERRAHYSVNKNMSSSTRNRYYLNRSYIGDGGRPDIKTFDSKIKAHAYLMKIIKK